MTSEISEDELVEATKKILSVDIRQLVFPSRKTQATILLVGIFVASISSLSGMNKDWAWEIAKALITTWSNSLFKARTYRISILCND